MFSDFQRMEIALIIANKLFDKVEDIHFDRHKDPLSEDYTKQCTERLNCTPEEFDTIGSIADGLRYNYYMKLITGKCSLSALYSNSVEKIAEMVHSDLLLCGRIYSWFKYRRLIKKIQAVQSQII